jgi:hypothetical protein
MFAGCRCMPAAHQRRTAPLPVQVPLMRHPSTAELLCVNCGNYPTAAAATVGPPPPSAATETSEDARTLLPTVNGIAGHGSSCSSDEDGLLEAPPPLRTRLQPASAAAPPPHASNAADPAANRRSTEGAGGSNTAWIRQAGADVCSSLDARPAAAGSTHDASKEIAELMLEGWAMLQDHCPRWVGGCWWVVGLAKWCLLMPAFRHLPATGRPPCAGICVAPLIPHAPPAWLRPLPQVPEPAAAGQGWAHLLRWLPAVSGAGG